MSRDKPFNNRSCSSNLVPNTIWKNCVLFFAFLLYQKDVLGMRFLFMLVCKTYRSSNPILRCSCGMCSLRVSYRAYIKTCDQRLSKGVSKLNFIHYSCIAIFLFNTGLNKSALSTERVFCLSVFFAFCLYCLEYDVIFIDFITFV